MVAGVADANVKAIRPNNNRGAATTKLPSAVLTVRAADSKAENRQAFNNIRGGGGSLLACLPACLPHACGGRASRSSLDTAVQPTIPPCARTCSKVPSLNDGK